MTRASDAPVSSTTALPIDAHAWFAEIERLSFDFAADMARASLVSAEATRAAANRSHDHLLRHAMLVLGDERPVVLTKGGDHEVRYFELAKLRAKARALEAEAAHLRQCLAQHQASPNTRKDPQQ